MAEYSSVFTLTTTSYTVTFNAGSGDEYVLDPTQCSGLDGVEPRVQVDDKPLDDGGIVFTGYRKARYIVFAGVLLNRTGTTAARNTMEDNLLLAVEDMLTADGVLSWTPSGGSERDITVRHCSPKLEFTGAWLKSFAFGMVAADPRT